MNTRGHVTTFLPSRRIRTKKITYSKVVLGILLLLCVCGNLCSYLLAAHGLETVEGVTQSLNSVFGAAITGYLLKSLGEHCSMNKYRIEEEEP